MHSVVPEKLKRRSSKFTQNNPKVGVVVTEQFNIFEAVNNDGFVYYCEAKEIEGFQKVFEADVSTIVQYMKKHKGFRDNLLREMHIEFYPSELKEWEKENETTV
jgi:protein associated with RNAse G/E